MEGFSCTDFRDRTEEAYRALIEWHAAGRLLFQVNVVDGLKEAPKTFIRIFGNTYRGKTVVKIS
jgi:NADPH-dependent curcumin reductase CurA